MSIPIYILIPGTRIDEKIRLRDQMKKLNTINYNFHVICDIERKTIQGDFKNYRKKYPDQHNLTIRDIAFIQTMIDLCIFIKKKYYKPVVICTSDVYFHKEYFKQLKIVQNETAGMDLVNICKITTMENNTCGYICNSHFRNQLIHYGLNWFLENHFTFEEGLQEMTKESIIKTYNLNNYHLIHQYNDCNNPNYIGYKETKRRFVFIVPSYNNEKWIQNNLYSMLKQKYPREYWRMIYINDGSSDKTDELFHELTKSHNDKKILYIKNDVKYGQAFNRYIAYNMCDDDEYCIMLDGDDWLRGDYVLQYLNNFMNMHDIDITYGFYKEFINNKIVTMPWKLTDFSKRVIQNKTYRQDHWRSVHLRVLKAEYLKQVNPMDFIMENNEFIFCSTDMVESFACLELCNKRHKKVEEYLMIYNKENSAIYPESYYNQANRDEKFAIQKNVRSIKPYKKSQNKELVIIDVEQSNYKELIQHYKDNYQQTHDLFLTRNSLKEYFTNRLNSFNLTFIDNK